MKNTIKRLLLLLFCVSMTARAHEDLTVLLDWFINPNHAPLFVAKEFGFFKEAGLNVTLIGPADPADPPKLVAMGKADIAITYEPQLIEQVDQGLPLIRIGVLIDQPLDCLVVLNKSGIRSLADLKSKRIGYSTSGVANVALKTMLKTAGLTLNDVQHINVHYNLTQALLTRNVDAVTGMMRNFELIQLELAGSTPRVFYPEQSGMPTYSELIFVTRTDNLQDPRLIKFLKAITKATQYLVAHPDETWIAFATQHPELNNELSHRAWYATLPLLAKNPFVFKAADWQAFAKFMQQNGLIKQVQPVTHYTIDLTKG